jgi:hypothetical protein
MESHVTTASSATIDLLKAGKGRGLNAIELSAAIQTKLLELEDKFFNDHGKRVDYRRMRESQGFKEFRVTLDALKEVSLSELEKMPDPLRLSFFANLYNSLIIHAITVLGPPKDSPQDRSDFYGGKTGAVFNIGGHSFSPDDIEHGILRCNRPHPKSTLSSHFPQGDSRAALSLSYLDPRLHFILNCGAESCPPIQVLSGDPEEALIAAARAYLDHAIRVDDSKKLIYLPRIIDWYGSDFGIGAYGRVRVVVNLLSKDRREEVMEEIRQSFGGLKGILKDSHLAYDDYKWGLNGKI